jgi:uncharacterized membrane protein
MIRLTIPANDMQKLEQERFQHPHPRVQRKMEAVYLTGMGLWGGGGGGGRGAGGGGGGGGGEGGGL